jgi:hypothetical protein
MDTAQIRSHMPVVCSNNGQFAVVDHLADDHDHIKLARDADGVHHYIPTAWITWIDDKVHIDRPGGQAMREWTTAPPPSLPTAKTDPFIK